MGQGPVITDLQPQAKLQPEASQAGHSRQDAGPRCLCHPPCFLPSSDRARSPERQCPVTSHTKGEDHADAVFHIAQYRTRYVTARTPTAQSLSPSTNRQLASSDLSHISSSLASAQWTNRCRRPNRPALHPSPHTARPMLPLPLCDIPHLLGSRHGGTFLQNSTRAPHPRPSALPPSVTPLPTLRPPGTAVLPRPVVVPARLRTAKTVARARLVTAKKRKSPPQAHYRTLCCDPQ